MPWALLITNPRELITLFQICWRIQLLHQHTMAALVAKDLALKLYPLGKLLELVL